MPESPLIAAGAQVQPISAAPLHTNRMFTGLWTQRNPLRDAATTFLLEKFYSATRFESLIGGQNMEVTTRLTLATRPGSSVYNAGPFPPINRFYEFRAFSAGGENIRILASVDPATGLNYGTVRDVTGPANNVILQQKAVGAGRTSFQSVGNICFFADGVNASKYVLSGQSWTPNTAFAQGQFIVDPYNNLQLSIGSQTATLTNIQITSNVVTFFFSAATQLTVPVGAYLSGAGLTTVPALNSTPVKVISVSNGQQLSCAYLHADVPYSAETGTETTGAGFTGLIPAAWQPALGAVTLDNTAQWENRGPSVEQWGIATPLLAPTVTQALAPTIYPAWAANTWYGPLFVILQGGVLYQLTTAGVTAAALPTFSAGVGLTTADGTAVWTSLGPGVWTASHPYVVGNVIEASFTYYITVMQTTYTWNGYVNVPTVTYVQQPVTVTNLFKCTAAGNSGLAAPVWTNGYGTSVTESTGVGWVNQGAAIAWPGATQTLSLATQILDANNNVEAPQLIAKTGAAAPAWSAAAQSSTADGGQLWLNGGPYSKANSYAWQWAYSGKNSITGHIGTASPISLPYTVAADYLPVIQGQGIPNDPQIDELVIWRTLQGGSTLLYDATIPNPAVGAAANTWIFTDTTTDSGLNELITAPIDGSNNPPPVGWTPQAYYQGRIWGFVNNVLQYSGGPATITGSGNESFPGLNQFTFPSQGVTCWPTSIGLICYTNSDIWVVQGQGTSSSPYYVVNFQQGVGLASQDALAVNGSTGYGMLTSGQVVSMDPGAGELEVGFPIGDQFNALYTPAATYCAWHQGSSADMALYVADGAAGWFRMSAVSAPESGNTWSTRALIQGGVKAIASVETSPGIKALLLGPAAQGQPILKRDATTNADNGVPYQPFANIGSIVMAQPGTSAGVQFVTTEEMAIAGAKPCTVGILLDEISGAFTNLVHSTNDPPNLAPSQTVTTKRFWAMQSGKPVACRHLQVQIGWPAQNYPNELLTYTIYGRLPQKARK